MSELDPVVLKFMAETSKFQADLRITTRTVDQALGTQERRVKKLEAEFRNASTAIGASLKGFAATFATAFTGRELVGLIDSFTRLQNQLRVAGLEGQQLADVQERLRVIGRTYGADLESLATTFSRIAQVQGDLGASTEDIIRLNEIVAASLKVAGTDAQTASGALLQLGQAFGSGAVRSEEFNSVLEGALPLAQAAARGIEGFGGSVAKLRTAIAAGQITSKQFFEGVLRGGVQTIKDAENATLTLSGAFTALRNELTTYVGSNAAATGATGLLANAIGELADNIDTSAATIGLGVTLNGVAATARTAGIALTGAFGGPIGLAVGALVVGLTSLALASEDAAAKTARLKSETDQARATLETYQQRLRDAGVAVQGIGAKSDEAAGKVRNLGDQLAITAQQALDFANKLQLAELIKIGAQRNEIAREREGVVRRQQQSQQARDSLLGRAFASPKIDQETARRQRSELAQLDERAQLLRGQAEAIIAGARTGVDVVSGGGPDTAPAPAPTPTSTRTTGGGASRSAGTGRDIGEIERRFADELDSLRSRLAAAEAIRATTVEERAEFERRQLELAEASALRSLEADTDYTEAQKARVRQSILALADAERDAIAFRERAEIERRQLELAEERGRAQIDALRLQFDLADTEKDRRAIALQILDAENDLLRSRLEAIIASDTANDIERERAKIAVQALNAQEAAQRASVNRQFATPLEQFALDAKDSDTRIQQAIVRRIKDLNDT